MLRFYILNPVSLTRRWPTTTSTHSLTRWSSSTSQAHRSHRPHIASFWSSLAVVSPCYFFGLCLLLSSCCRQYKVCPFLRLQGLSGPHLVLLQVHLPDFPSGPSLQTAIVLSQSRARIPRVCPLPQSRSQQRVERSVASASSQRTTTRSARTILATSTWTLIRLPSMVNLRRTATGKVSR